MRHVKTRVDGRSRRKTRTESAIRSALERLLNGDGTHPRHAGLKVRVTKAAIAREARINIATVYRFPDLCAEIDAVTREAPARRQQRSIQVRNKLVKEITLLKDQLNKALQENLRLARTLEKYDPTLGIPEPIALDERRKTRKKRASR